MVIKGSMVPARNIFVNANVVGRSFPALLIYDSYITITEALISNI